MAGRQLVTGPAFEPVSLAEARAHCRISGTDEDGLLAGYILDAREHIERETGRALITQRWKALYDRCWPISWDGLCYRQRIVLPTPPLKAVVSVQYVDTNGALQELTASEYLAARVGDPREQGFVEPAWGKSWPGVRAQAEAVTVTFDAGYGDAPGDVPKELHEAILLLVEHWYEHRAAAAEQAVSEIPLGVERLIQRYRVSA